MPRMRWKLAGSMRSLVPLGFRARVVAGLALDSPLGFRVCVGAGEETDGEEPAGEESGEETVGEEPAGEEPLDSQLGFLVRPPGVGELLPLDGSETCDSDVPRLSEAGSGTAATGSVEITVGQTHFEDIIRCDSIF